MEPLSYNNCRETQEIQSWETRLYKKELSNASEGMNALQNITYNF